MKLREFLKATREKMILSIFLILILVVPWFSENIKCGVPCPGGVCPPCSSTECVCIYRHYSLFVSFQDNQIIIPIVKIFVTLQIILGIVISYLISCVIIWVYNRRRKKKEI
jgi:hypothetical protein